MIWDDDIIHHCVKKKKHGRRTNEFNLIARNDVQRKLVDISTYAGNMKNA